MRHLVPIATLALCLALAVGVLDRLGRHSDQAGLLLVVTRGDAGPALAAVLAGQDLRLLDVSMGGRLLQLHADSLGRVRVEGNEVVLALRVPLQGLGLPICG